MELVKLTAGLYEKISDPKFESASNGTAVDASGNAVKSFKEALNRHYWNFESTEQVLEIIETLKLTMKSEFNIFIQQIRPSIKLITGDNNTLAIAILRNQVDPDIRNYVPKVANESF
ncbi:hypothetical protein AYI68_g3073 [Smittium mucronatum]|uniref:Uncharacterized protein n=1 Tax=Smittium mucronatum TaxID=133383 RepID=A0A1R0H0V6_9FUNG|nr:hypothetical protein AYI68_g3073 [Smittium mucronatum]